jgi:hypothetical protein
MLVDIFCRFMLAFHHINFDELVWDLLLLEDGNHPATAG